MKKLVMIRHAKSSWSDENLKDFDRGLNKRGKADAPFMAKKLDEYQIKPDAVILSSSKRTNLTWKKMNEIFDLPKKNVTEYDQLYHSSASEILNIINQQSDDIETLFCIVHNPGITQFVNLLCQVDILNIPTTGISVIEVPNFSSLEVGQGKLMHYIYPKQF